MVAKTQSTRQANDPRKVLRKLLAMHVLHLQFYLRHDCNVGQVMVVGHQAVLVQLSTSGKDWR
jgi:hypothetical protein